jgi:hypothetical protein
MTCETCGCAVHITDSTPAKSSGRFREEYECASGHTGWVTGQEDAHPDEWRRGGAVFQDHHEVLNQR